MLSVRCLLLGCCRSRLLFVVVTCRALLVVCCVLTCDDVCGLLFVVRCLMFVDCRFVLFVGCCLLCNDCCFVACCYLLFSVFCVFRVCCLLFVEYDLLFDVCCLLCLLVMCC